MGGGLVPGIFPPPESMRPTLVGDRWAVVAGHPLVTQIAAEVLTRGGNAVDAGVAAGLATNVIQADMANLGGIAPILVRTAGTSTVDSIAGVGRWGADADRADLLTRYAGELPLGGVPSIVPGAVSAWITALERYGTWSFAEVAAPAIECAERGFPLDLRTAISLELMSADFGQWESSRRIYLPDGRPPEAGERLVQTDLGRLLRDLASAERGFTRADGLNAVHDRFYRGDIAARIVAFVRARGSSLTESDFASFRAEVAPAPAVRYGRWRMHTTPGWSQGLVIGQTLGVLEHFDISQMGHNSSEYLHHLIEALKVSFFDRENFLCDPDFAKLSAAELLSGDHLARMAGRIGPAARASRAGKASSPRPMHSTTAITVVDEAGNAFSTAPSDTLDGAPIVPGLGIMCSPRGVQSRLAAHHVNRIEPGKRPCVTPAPLIGLSMNETPAVWAVACPGGDVLVQAMVQAILNVTDFGMTLQQATEAPRIAEFSFPGAFHPNPGADRLVYAENRIGVEVRRELAERGHRLVAWPSFEFDAGSVQMVLSSMTKRGDRNVAAGADPRRSAYAAAR